VLGDREGVVEGVRVGTFVGDGVGEGEVYGGGALRGQPLPIHLKDEAPLTATLSSSQFPDGHASEQGALAAHSNTAAPEHALPPEHAIEMEDAPLGTRVESVHACSPEQRSEHGCPARHFSVTPPLQKSLPMQFNSHGSLRVH